MLSGVERTMNIDVTFEQLHQWEVEGQPIQRVMPHLTAAEREFIMTGITDEEWQQMCPDEEEDV